MKRVLIILLLFSISGNLHADINDGLIAFFPFEGNANDTSGNGNNGIEHGVTYTIGKIGKAATFDGVNDYIQVTNSITLNTSKYSLSCWVNFSNVKQQVFIDKRNGWKMRNFSLALTDKSIIEGCSGDGTNYFVYGNNSVIINEFYHIVLTYDQQNLKLYVNGIEKNNTHCTTTTNIGNGDILIGCHGESDFYFKGTIDQLRIYNRSITQSEIQELFNETNCIDACSQDELDAQFVAGKQYCIDHPEQCWPTKKIYTEEEVLNMINKLLEWDVNNDKQIGLIEALHVLKDLTSSGSK